MFSWSWSLFLPISTVVPVRVQVLMAFITVHALNITCARKISPTDCFMRALLYLFSVNKPGTFHNLETVWRCPFFIAEVMKRIQVTWIMCPAAISRLSSFQVVMCEGRSTSGEVSAGNLRSYQTRRIRTRKRNYRRPNQHLLKLITIISDNYFCLQYKVLNMSLKISLTWPKADAAQQRCCIFKLLMREINEAERRVNPTPTWSTTVFKLSKQILLFSRKFQVKCKFIMLIVCDDMCSCVDMRFAL